MARITCAIKTPFGEIRVSGDSPEEVLDALQDLDQVFVKEVNERVSDILATQAKDILNGIVEVGRDGPIKCRFEELRHNPFHKLPKRFKGRMWWDPAIGLCLYYEQPSELRINILPEGVFIGRPDEPPEPIPGNGQDDVMKLFSKLFNWDVAWLAATFSTEGKMEDTGTWQLQFRPLEEDLSQQVRRMDLRGESGLLTRIYLHLRGGRKIEIRLSDQARLCQLDEETLRRAFPNHDG